MSEKRVVKKYPNRRLYDTAISSYITLEEVKQLVVDNVDVQVIDARTQSDLTHNTLLQIMVEQENGAAPGPLLSVSALQAFIRLHGSPLHTMINKLLEQNALYFLRKQDNLQESFNAQEATAWHQLQEEWWQTFSQTLQGPTVQLKTTLETVSVPA
jgi:polyhydroxyalkanoate synthesis repressor PhaR